MNTETLSALKRVNLQIQDLQDQLDSQTLTKVEASSVGQALVQLEITQDTLIHQVLQAMIDQLNTANVQLLAVLKQMQAVSDRLAKLAATIKKVSDVVGALVEITSKALSAGLLG